MEKEVKVGIIILILAVLLLGITFVINISNALSFLNKPIISNGLGPLCSSLSDCRDFCFTNRGLCNEYCRANPENKICYLITPKDLK